MNSPFCEPVLWRYYGGKMIPFYDCNWFIIYALYFYTPGLGASLAFGAGSLHWVVAGIYSSGRDLRLVKAGKGNTNKLLLLQLSILMTFNESALFRPNLYISKVTLYFYSLRCWGTVDERTIVSTRIMSTQSLYLTFSCIE